MGLATARARPCASFRHPRVSVRTPEPRPGACVRILLINAFHYPRGGVERIYLDESRWLAGAGHEVLHFAIRDPRNLPSPTAGSFAPPADYGEGGDPWRQLV